MLTLGVRSWPGALLSGIDDSQDFSRVECLKMCDISCNNAGESTGHSGYKEICNRTARYDATTGPPRLRLAMPRTKCIGRIILTPGRV